MAIAIDSHVAPPTEGNQRGRRSTYPFGSLKVGESFFVDDATATKARLAASAWKRNHPGWDYTGRNEEGGVRIWRLA